MKVAFIPPFSLLGQTARTDYQLMLPHLLSNEVYHQRCTELCANPHQFVILDNGAAEGVRISDSQLLLLAGTYRVSELAIPDVLYDSKATLKRMDSFMQIYTSTFGVKNCQLGFVAQGLNSAESMYTVREVLNGPWEPYISTVYIPRLLIQASGDRRERIKVAQRIDQEFGPRLAIHFFGASPLWCSEVQEAARVVPFVRGIDTSMPFNYAYHNIRIEYDTNAYPLDNPIERPNHYFELSAEHFNTRKLIDNQKTYLAWAGGAGCQFLRGNIHWPNVKNVH